MGGGTSIAACTSCQHEFFEKWGPEFVCCDCWQKLSDTFEDERIKSELALMQKIDQEDMSLPSDGVLRGVSIRFIMDFTTKNNLWDLTTREVRRKFIMPATKELRCRYVELPHMVGTTNTGKAVSFVSHTWGAKFGDLVAALCDGNADLDRIVWVDIFAVRQWPSLRPDLDFSSTVKQCNSFVIVCSSLPDISVNFDKLPSNIRVQIAFFRVWCLVEIHAAATSSGVHMMLKGGNHDRFNNTGRPLFKSNQDTINALGNVVDIRKAEATILSDKERILADIEANGGVDELNRIVKRMISGSLSASKHPLVQCAVCGDQSALQAILANPTEYLIAATACGDRTLFHALLAAGADVNTSFEERCYGGEYTALMAAASANHADCIADLIAAGANIDTITGGGYSAVTYAVMTGETESLELLLKSGAKCGHMFRNSEPLTVHAAYFNHVECMNLLIQYGCDMNEADEKGVTPLIAGILAGNVNIVLSLLRHRCDVSVTYRGHNVLSLAQAAKQTECYDFLILCLNEHDQ